MPGLSVSYSTSDGASAVQPFTTAQMKQHLRVTSSTTEDDAEIDRLTLAAREQVESYTGRSMMKQQVTLKLSRFPHGIHERIYLPRPPLRSVSSITYIENTSGTTSTWASSDYEVHTTPQPGFVSLGRNDEWPSDIETTVADPVTVTYLAGFATSTGQDVGPHGVYQRMRQALALTVGNWYENREAVITGTIGTALPQSAKWLLDGLKVGSYPGLYRLR